MSEAICGADLSARDPAYRFAHAGYLLIRIFDWLVPSFVKAPLDSCFSALGGAPGAICSGFSAAGTVEAESAHAVKFAHDENFGTDWAGKCSIVAIPIGVRIRSHWFARIVSVRIKVTDWHGNFLHIEAASVGASSFSKRLFRCSSNPGHAEA
jgi:hypothetical protein